MLPRELTSEHFAGYPPEARKLATGSLAALQRLPLSFLPGLLREVIEYDFKFPAERILFGSHSLLNSSASIGSIFPPNLSSSFQHIFGQRTSWMHFA